MSTPIHLESLHIALATADILRESGERFSLVFASHLAATPAAREAGMTIDDAQIVGQALVEALLALTTRLPFPQADDVAQRLHGRAPRTAVERAFVAACEDIFPAPGRGMTVTAWREMLTWLLSASPPPDCRSRVVRPW